MRRARPRIGCDPADRRAVELHRETGRQIVRHEDRVPIGARGHGVAIWKPEEDREEPDLDIDQIAGALAHQRIR